MELFKGTVYDFSIKTTLRGCWFKMMNDALCVSTEREKSYFCSFLRRLQRFFPCGECKDHFREYLISNPPEYTKDMFDYIASFMNDVAIRVGRPIRNINILRRLFTDPAAHHNIVISNGDYDFRMTDKMRGCWLKIFCDSAYLDIINNEHYEVFYCKCLRRMQLFSPYKEELQEFFSINPPEDIIIQRDSFFDYSVNMVNWCLANQSTIIYNPDLLWTLFTVEGKNTCHDSCDGSISSLGHTTATVKRLRDHINRNK